MRRAFALSVVLACVAWSGASQTGGRPEPPAHDPSSRPEASVVRPTLRTLAPADAAATTRVRDAYGKLPLSFELNRGQTDPQVKFLSRGPGYTLFLTATEAV